MPRRSKHPRLTFKPKFQAQSEICAPTADEEELRDASSTSSCSFTYYNFSSTTSSPLSSPVIPDTSEDQGEEQEEEQEEEEEEEEEEMEEEVVKNEVEGYKEEEMNEEEQEQPAAETSSPPQGNQGSTPGSRNQENKGPSSLKISIDLQSLFRDSLDEEVANLVHFMVRKYRLRKSVTKAEMLKVVNKQESQFAVIFYKACKCLEAISGIDVKKVVPATHSYVLVNSLDLTYDEMLSDPQSIPKNGLLIVILGMIFLEGNCASEKDMWGFLNILGVYAGREHFIYGEPRKLITRTWVQENYLEYQQVPSSDPPRYKFMWGPRAHAETSKLQVLEFLAKIKGTDPISFSCWYEEALRDEQERAQARTGPVGRAAAAAVFMELQ